MRVLVACEFSGVVREAFRKRGHDAWSCDLLPSEIPGQHHQYGILDLLLYRDKLWDLLIAFPPCTHLAVSGARWFREKRQEQGEAILFVKELAAMNIQKVAIEN